MKKPASEVVSLGDVAKAAGVSRMTASLALRNKPDVSAKTRARVAKIAKQLGYAPDPRIAVRMADVRNTKNRERLPIAWLDLNDTPNLWKTTPHNSPYREGAKLRCEELGYEFQEFWLREPGMTPKRLSQILYHRGIQGVIVSPPVHIGLAHLQLNWQFLACASFEKGITAPKMHRVAQDLYYNIMLALKLVRRFGYQRIGVVLQQQSDRRSYHAIQAAVGYFQSTLDPAYRIPPVLHVYRDIAGPEFSVWIKKYRPDVIVGHDNRLVEWAEAAGFKVPSQIGVIHLALDNDCLDWAGIFARKKDIGAATANLVITQIQNNQLGLPEVPMDTVVQGKWQTGKTLLIPRPSSIGRKITAVKKKS